MEPIQQIDWLFDFRTDTRVGGDVDALSPTLRRYHQILWHKPLPGRSFGLVTSAPGRHLHHRSEHGDFPMRSDSFQTFATWNSLKHITTQLPQCDLDDFVTLSYRIGGMLVFPCRTENRLHTINQARGIRMLVADRLDLTLECIRRHYVGADSPLADVIERYKVFFDLFGDFRGYVDYFLLQDAVTPSYDIDFVLPFDDFVSRGTPQTVDAYDQYRHRSIDFIVARGKRMAVAIGCAAVQRHDLPDSLD